MTITAPAKGSATYGVGHPADCLCVPCMMADMDATMAENGQNPDSYATVITSTAERTRYAQPGQRSGRGFVRKLSERQVKFIKGLLRTRDTRNLVRLPGSEDVENMSLKGASDLIERLLACPELLNPNLATEKQVAFATSLATERGVSAEGFAQLTKKGISKKIDELKAIPRPAPKVTSAPATSPDAPEVPEGRYAIEIDGTLKFYQIDRPTEGKWAGWVFVKVQASDDTYPIRNREAKAKVLAEIAKDPKAAMLRYGQEIGRCGHCNRTLTDEASRARGIGPVCATKF